MSPWVIIVAWAVAIAAASTLTRDQMEGLLAVAMIVAAALWQASHPTPTLATLYEQEPRWGHVALDFAPRLTATVQACARGLATTSP